jgi:anti-sigma regulatory factor (Ser/Thr protein kinase)
VPLEPLRVAASLDSLAAIGQYVLAAAAAAQLDRRAAYRLRLAVDEIATNIISHGYAEAGGDGDVEVATVITPDTVTIVLDDAAVPFDPRERSRPDQIDALSLDDRPVGGLGVFLAMAGVDEFRYEHVGGHNRNYFVVRRPAVPA